MQGAEIMGKRQRPQLTDDDFPLVADGNRIFARTRSAPILLAIDDRMATEIAERLNRDCDFVTIPRLT